MTNAEKYLKEGVSVKEFASELTEQLYYYKPEYFEEEIHKFFNAPVQLTLTEDEKVILRNLRDNPKYIKRRGKYYLLCYDKIDNLGGITNGHDITAFGHLFQFIKNEEEYKIEELFK